MGEEKEVVIRLMRKVIAYQQTDEVRTAMYVVYLFRLLSISSSS